MNSYEERQIKIAELSALIAHHGLYRTLHGNRMRELTAIRDTLLNGDPLPGDDPIIRDLDAMRRYVGHPDLTAEQADKIMREPDHFPGYIPQCDPKEIQWALNAESQAMIIEAIKAMDGATAQQIRDWMDREREVMTEVAAIEQYLEQWLREGKVRCNSALAGDVWIMPARNTNPG